MRIKSIIRKYIPSVLIEEFLSFLSKLKALGYFVFHVKEIKKYKSKRKVLYLMTPTHHNIGDAAIALGGLHFLNNTFKEEEIVEFTDEELFYKRYFIRSICNEEDLVVMHGGGNLGDWYPTWELLREDVLKLFKNKRVLILPQTISFGNRKGYEWLLKRAIRVYSGMNNITMICRDNRSINIASNILKVQNTKLAPDIALCLPRIKKNKEHFGVVSVCLRKDIEKSRSVEMDQAVINSCYRHGLEINYTDTISPEKIRKEDRETVVRNKIEEFKHSDLVITDRYHGVILSYLANTPCIAISNKDGKVVEAMYFFDSLKYIKLLENNDDIDNLMEQLLYVDTSESIDYTLKFFSGMLSV